MKTEELIELGLTEEQAKQVLVINGKDIEKHKNQSETFKTQAETFKTQLETANKEIENFKTLDIEGVRKSAEDWKLKAEKAQNDANDKLYKLQFDYALDGALSGAKAKNIKAVKALLDMEKIKFENDSLTGFDEQLKQIKTDNDYLFVTDEQAPQIIKSTKGATNNLTLSDSDNAMRMAAGLKPL